MTYQLHDIKKYKKKVGSVCSSCGKYHRPTYSESYTLSCPRCGLNPYCLECWHDLVFDGILDDDISQCHCRYCEGHLYNSDDPPLSELSVANKWLYTATKKMFVVKLDFIKHEDYDELTEKDTFMRDYFINLKNKYPALSL